MQFIHAILLGVVEGVTEFLPISSTFHLIWTSTLLHLPQSDFIALFEVAIQGGAIIAVVFLYRMELFTDKKLVQKLAASFIPTAIVGFILHSFIKKVLFSEVLISTVVFTLIGLIFLWVEWAQSRQTTKKSIADLGWGEALGVGLVQSLAVVPGVSRAGAVMVGMMFMGYKRDESAKYSFLLAVPTILAASAYDLFKMRQVIVAQSENLPLLLVGTFVAMFTAFISIRFLIDYLKNHTLKMFALYRLIVGIILLLVYWGFMSR